MSERNKSMSKILKDKTSIMVQIIRNITCNNKQITGILKKVTKFIFYLIKDAKLKN